MKTQLIPKLTQTQQFNKKQQQYLHILSCNSIQLQSYLKELSIDNPCIQMKEDGYDLLLEYQYNKPDLREHILNLVRLFNEKIDEMVVEYLISCLNDNGYFDKPLDSILKESNWNKETLLYHINLLRQCEPYGLFSFDLKQCLQIQCEQSEKPESETGYILCSYLNELAYFKFDEIIEKTDLEYDEIIEGFQFIKTLDPKPGSAFSKKSTYLVPECKIRIIDEQIKIEMFNIDVDIELIDSEVLKEQRKQALLIFNAMQKRNMTLIQILNAICQIQKDFFLYHKELKPCTLEKIAKECGLAISTVSRAIMNKSFEFENEYYPIKYLFSHGGVSQLSKQYIQNQIKKIIDQEDKNYPFSDEKIRKYLEKENIIVSRRTITKYREQMFILNSRQRKIWEE